MGLPYSSFGGRAPLLSRTFSSTHTLTTPGTARLHWLSLLPGGHHASDPAPSETCGLAPTALLQTVPSSVLPASLQIPGTETLVAEDPSDWGGLGGGFRSSLSLGCSFNQATPGTKPSGLMTHPTALSLPLWRRPLTCYHCRLQQFPRPQEAAQALRRAGSLNLRVQTLWSIVKHGRGGSGAARRHWPVPSSDHLVGGPQQLGNLGIQETGV